MGFFKEFQKFAMQGNVMDLAVGVIIGAAFGKIVSSLVNDIVMPLVGLLMGGVNFSDLKLTLKAAEGDKPASTLNYGAFAQNIVDFLIIALAIFIVIRAINSMKKKQAEVPPAPTNQEVLLTEIRDLLKKQS